MKPMIVFDLDNTLTESKSSIDNEMAGLLKELLSKKFVCVISGGDWPQYSNQLLSKLPDDEDLLKRLYLLPTCGSKCFIYKGHWSKLYSHALTEEEKKKITDALNYAVRTSGIVIEQLWGPQIEDRESQITFSALGQLAPSENKKVWDKDFSKRKQLQQIAQELVPEFSVRVGGSTSLDITRTGIDKSFGCRELSKITGFKQSEMLFIGDAIFPGGNDYSVKEAGIDCIHIHNIEETKRVIETIVKL